MHIFCQAVVFALACNIDTVIAAVGLSAPVHRWEDLAVAALTSLFTYLSLLLGAGGGALLPAHLADRLGGVVLIALGLWCLTARLRREGGDAPRQGNWLSLSLALAVNNVGVGVAAGVAGMGAFVGAGSNFLVTLASLALGRQLGARLERWSALALPLSGALLILLGAGQLR